MRLKHIERKKNLWNKELWTQQEVARYFRVVSGTVKNWREQGLLRYWQAPGSSVGVRQLKVNLFKTQKERKNIKK